MKTLAVGARVEVELSGASHDATIEGFDLGRIVEVELTEAWDPHVAAVDDAFYLVEFDTFRAERKPDPHRQGETDSRGWVAWEFVRELSLLELIAEAAQ